MFRTQRCGMLSARTATPHSSTATTNSPPPNKRQTETNNDVNREMAAGGEAFQYCHINTIQPLVCPSLQTLEMLSTLECELVWWWESGGVGRVCCQGVSVLVHTLWMSQHVGLVVSPNSNPPSLPPTYTHPLSSPLFASPPPSPHLPLSFLSRWWW